MGSVDYNKKKGYDDERGAWKGCPEGERRGSWGWAYWRHSINTGNCQRRNMTLLERSPVE